MLVDPQRSSLTLVSPFLFPAERVDAVVARVAQAGATGRHGALPVWEDARLDTDEWLPHIARSLQPSSGIAPLVHFWMVARPFLEADTGLAARTPYEFVLAENQSVPLRVVDLLLVLFRNGTGFVVLRCKLESESPADWLDVQHHGRFAHLSRTRFLRKLKRTGKDQFERFFPDPFGHIAARPGGLDQLARGEGTLDDLLQIALHSAGLYPGGIAVPESVYLPGRLLPYNVLFLREGTLPEGPALPREELLYKLRRMLHAGQTYHPAADHLVLAPPNFHPYLREQWFFFSLEGGFVAIDAPDTDFFRHDLPHHLEQQYFFLFLLALQQRFTLMGLSADVAQHWKDRSQARSELRHIVERIRDRLFDFTARYYFLQVMQRENHHRCYQLWQERFQTRELYDEVCTEVREMSETLEDRDKLAHDQRLTRLTLLLTILIGAPSLAIGFWNINVVGYTSAEGLSLEAALANVGLLAAAVGLLFTFVWLLLLRRR